MFNIPCVVHTLQLSVLKSFELKEVSKMLGKIAGHFYRSPKAPAKLCEKQQLHVLGAPIHKLLLNDCVKR